MKIAVLGGSFNPVHIGHLALADEVISLGYDKVLFIPAASAPHKQMAFPVAAEKRAEMVSLAIEDNPSFELERCEIDRGGTSYTWDTICYLEKKYAAVLEGKIGLIIGRDQFATFHLWKHALEISEKCQLILGERPLGAATKNSNGNSNENLIENKNKTAPENSIKKSGIKAAVNSGKNSCEVSCENSGKSCIKSSIENPAVEIEKFSNKATGCYADFNSSDCKNFDIKAEPLFKNAIFLFNEPLDVSSTEIRKRAGTGKAFRYLVPQKVFKYIIDGKIYDK